MKLSNEIFTEASGTVAEISGDVWVIRDGMREQLNSEDAVFKGDIIETSEGGMIEIIFSDGSQLNLGNDARLAVGSEGSMSLLKGVFSFVSPEDMMINTPIAEMSLRDAKLVGKIAPSGESSITLLEGSVVLSNAGGSLELNEAFATATMSSAKMVSAVTAPEDAGILTLDQAVARYVAIFEGDAGLLAGFIAEEMPQIDVALAEAVLAEEESGWVDWLIAAGVAEAAEEPIEATAEEITEPIADIPVLSELLDLSGLLDGIDASNLGTLPVFSEAVNAPINPSVTLTAFTRDTFAGGATSTKCDDTFFANPQP